MGFSIIVDNADNKELYELGRVIKRAASNGHKEAKLYVASLNPPHVSILTQQVLDLDYVYIMARDESIKIPQSFNIDSVCLHLDNDVTGAIAQDNAMAMLNSEFLIVATNSVDFMGNFSANVIAQAVDQQKNIYLIQDDDSSWYAKPSYNSELLGLANRVKKRASTLFSSDEKSEGAYAEVADLVLPETVKRYKESK
jgi:hypothetical protein